MKDATGELNMTVITVVAIAAIAAFFTAFILPRMKGGISGATKCASAVGCKECDLSNNTKPCSGYYDSTGKYVEEPITCNCTNEKQ